MMVKLTFHRLGKEKIDRSKIKERRGIHGCIETLDAFMYECLQIPIENSKYKYNHDI